MTKFTIIPVGYRLTIDSWENDGDNSQTHTKNGLTLEEVKFHVELCQLLDSEKFGNKVEGELLDDYYEALQLVAQKHKNLIPSDTDIIDFLTNISDDYTGYSENYMTRVYDSHKVEYIPTEIKIEDVTEQFKKIS